MLREREVERGLAPLLPHLEGEASQRRIEDDEGSDAEEAKDPTVGDVVEYDGQQALQLVTEQDSGTTTVWVAAEGAHYILRMENVGETEPGTITMTDFNEPLEVEAPAEDDYIDLSSL